MLPPLLPHLPRLLLLLLLLPSSPLSEPMPIRLNKCFKRTHSRREADKLIADGRVLVNDHLPTGAGDQVTPSIDVVKLDNSVVSFSDFNDAPPSTHYYAKYWKPRGIITTTDTRIRDNIITSLSATPNFAAEFSDSRMYPVGRLDKDTHGLMLLTNDGRLPNAVLRSDQRKDKVYLVTTSSSPSLLQLDRLRSGVLITTVAQRDNRRKEPLTALTKPCEVERTKRPRQFSITLQEGRNRQIR